MQVIVMPGRPRILALVATLSAANAALRIGLAWGPPNVKPTAFLVIIGGVVACPMPGFIIGWLSMTISDLATPLGAGYWTIETSAAMAFVGLLAGVVFGKANKKKQTRLGGVWFFLSGVF